MDQVTTVRGVLHEIGAGGLPELLVLDKADIAPAEWTRRLRQAHPDAVVVSALTGDGIDELRTAVRRRLPGKKRSG